MTRTYSRSLGSLESQPLSEHVVTFPLLAVKRVSLDWRLGGGWPLKIWRNWSLLCFFCLILPLQPHCMCTSSGPLSSPKTDLSSISSSLLFLRNVTVTSLPTPTSLLAFLLFARHCTWAREMQMKDIVWALRLLAIWAKEVFSLDDLIAKTAPSLTEWGAFPGLVARMFHFLPEFWVSCQQSFLSSPWGAVVVSGDLWEFTYPFKKTYTSLVEVYRREYL